jgi:polyisoprenoid-binding protein YceI
MKRVFLALGLIATIGIGAPAYAQAPNEWTIDTSHTAAQFAVRHLMVSTVRGQLGPVKGTIVWNGEDVKTIAVDVTIDVAGIDTRVENRDNHLRTPDFFDAANHPTMTFKSKRAEPAGEGRFKLIGDLTIRGNTQEVVLDVEGPMPVVKQRNSLRTGASATTKISRKAFGLLWNNLMETGGAVVADEVQVQIDLEAIQKIVEAGK